MNKQKMIDEIKQLIKDHPLSYFSIAFSKQHTEMTKFILENSSFLDDKVEPRTQKPYSKASRIVYAINGLIDFPKCATCGKSIIRNIAPKEDLNHIHCCNKCAQKAPDTIAKTKATKLKNHGDPNYNNMEKNKATCKEKFGVEYVFQAKEVKEKSKQSIKNHFGVDHQMRSDIVKEEMCKRYREKHGVDYPFQDPEIQAKINATIHKNYGVDWPMQNKELHAIMHKNSVIAQKRNFYNDKLCKLDDLEPLFTVDEYIEYGMRDHTHMFKWRCKKCGSEFYSRMLLGCSYFARCIKCNPYLYTTSKFEKEVAAFINSLGNGIIALNKTDENKMIINPQEIDIIVKKNGVNSLFIETNGLFWHSTENGKDKFYHRFKTDKCNKIGVQLIHIFEDEWHEKKDIVKSRLKNLLGIYDKIIYARKCCVKEISSRESSKFFSETHIQGNCNASIRYGLFYENELIAAMTFSRRRKITNAKSIEGEYELLRFSTKLGYHIIGGAGKLLKYFERNTCGLKMLISYADARWSVGKLYEALGFKLDHISQPNYWYMTPKCNKRLYRYGFRKSILKNILENYDENKTEIENMFTHGYHMIWDCGNYVFKKCYDDMIFLH